MDEEYADIYYVDTRNATRDHRPQQQGRSPAPGWICWFSAHPDP
jgi:hypothetical protein